MTVAGRATLVIAQSSIIALVLQVMALFQKNEILSAPVASGILIMTFGGYILTCLVTLRSSRTQFANASLFSILSLTLLGNLLTGFAIIYKHAGLTGPVGEKFEPSWSALYFSVITWTTVGYGDFQPTPAARPYAALEAITGLIFMALFIATLVHVANTTSQEK